MATDAKSLPWHLRCLALADKRAWHYSFLTVLVLDYTANCLAVAATTTETYGNIGLYLRLASSACLVAELGDLILRILGLGRALWRSAANVLDLFVFLLLAICLGARYYFADNLETAKLVEAGWTDQWKIRTKYKLDQVESYIAVGYCMLVMLRILLKPPARTYSKTLHRAPKPDRIFIQSLRASIRQLPQITTVAVENMETELRKVCGMEDGWMLPEAFMTFVERAYKHRPVGMTTDDFLTHFQQVQVLDRQLGAYGMRQVMTSTFRHWSSQKWFLAGTMFVVCIAASIVPLLAYFLQYITDRAFPASIFKDMTQDFNDDYITTNGHQSLLILNKSKNEAVDDFGELRQLPFKPKDSLYIGIIGVLGICVP
ncbi:ATP-binding Cassette (ABC) Superfamily, partial [Achlya hypogyna]